MRGETNRASEGHTCSVAGDLWSLFEIHNHPISNRDVIHCIVRRGHLGVIREPVLIRRCTIRIMHEGGHEACAFVRARFE